MKLADLISEYTANGYVLQSLGNGSTSPMWIDYQAAIEIDASIADIGMHIPDGYELTSADLREELARYVSDVPGTGCCSKAFDDSGRCIAVRHWDKKRVSWIVKPA